MGIFRKNILPSLLMLFTSTSCYCRASSSSIKVEEHPALSNAPLVVAATPIVTPINDVKKAPDTKRTMKVKNKVKVQKLVAKQSSTLSQLPEKVILPQEPEVDALLASGKVKFDKKDYTGAEKDFSAAVILDPNSALANHRLGYTRIEMGKIQEALNNLNKAIELKPDYIHAYNNRGRAKSRLNDYGGARKDFEKTLELDPDYILAYINLIDNFMKTSAIGDAISVCAKGKIRFETVSRANINDKYPKSMNLKGSLPVDQHYGMLFYNCAVAKKEAGNFKEALEDIDWAIALSPNNSYFKNMRKGFE